MTRIGVTCNALQPGGGLERYAIDLVRGLHAAGIRPIVFARQFDESLAEHAYIDQYRVPVGALPGKLRDLYFSYCIGRLKHKFGIDWLIGCNRVAASDIAICGGTHRGFLRATARRRRWSDAWQIALERRQYGRAACIVAHSRLMADELSELYGVPQHKIALLYPPVDARRFSPVDAETKRALRARFGLPNDRVVFVFASGSHLRKGLPILARAFERSSLPVSLAVAGRPVERLSAKLHYLGFCADIESLYRAADYTILASQYEPFGLVGIESVLCGTPTVLASNIGCGEVLSNHAKIVFDRHHEASLEAALAQAVARVRNGGGKTLRNAAQQVLYDTDINHHVRALLALRQRPLGSEAAAFYDSEAASCARRS